MIYTVGEMAKTFIDTKRDAVKKQIEDLQKILYVLE